MQNNPLVNKRKLEIEAEINLAQSVMLAESPIPVPAPPPSMPVPAPPLPANQSDSQTRGRMNKTKWQRHAEYTQIIEGIRIKYQDPHLADLFEAAYIQLNLYLNAYLELISAEKATLFNKEDPGIFLDFGEKAKICRYPLARKFIITIPLEDALAEPPIWNSMAHELGHFAYWNSEFEVSADEKIASPKKYTLFSSEIVETLGLEMENFIGVGNNVSSATKKQVLACMLVGWSEEIFADIFGAVVGGVEFAEQAKAAYLNDLAQLDKKRFETDIDHPYALLRPYISATALEHKNGKNSLWRALKQKIAANTNLEENFRQSLNNQSEPPGAVMDISDENLKVAIKVGEDSVLVSLDEIKRAISETIPLLTDKIRTSKPLARWINLWDFIEEFDDPQPAPLIYLVIQGIGYWVNAAWR